MNKKEKMVLVDWFNSDLYDLNQCYGKHSEKKDEAINYCRELYNTLGGFRFRIISYNRYNFSVGFYFYDSAGEHFCYIRKNHIEIFKSRLEEDENNEDFKDISLFSYVDCKIHRGEF